MAAAFSQQLNQVMSCICFAADEILLVLLHCRACFHQLLKKLETKMCCL